MTDKYLVGFLKIEYQRLREDRRNLTNNLFQLFVLLLSISILGIASIIQFDISSINNKSTSGILNISSFWDIVMIAYPFVIYIFVQVFFVLSSAVLYNSVTLLIIEKEINKRLGKNILNWENMVVVNNSYKISSTNFQATILIIPFLFSADIICISYSTTLFRCSFYQTLYLLVNGILLIILLSMLIYHWFFERKKLKIKLMGKYFTDIDSENKNV